MSTDERAPTENPEPGTVPPAGEALPRILPARGPADGDGALSQEGRAQFLWIDEESGDELTVEVSGNEDFFVVLERIGFQRQGGSGPGGPGGEGAQTSFEGGPQRAPRRSEGTRLKAHMDVGSRDRGAQAGGPVRPWQERRRA